MKFIEFAGKDKKIYYINVSHIVDILKTPNAECQVILSTNIILYPTATYEEIKSLIDG